MHPIHVSFLLAQILPGTDFLPTCCIAWIIQYTFLGNSLRGLLNFRPLGGKKEDKESEPDKKKK